MRQIYSAIAFIVAFTPLSAYAYPFNEKHAFCVERHYPLMMGSEYKFTVKYNQCMENPDKLIDQQKAKIRRQNGEFCEYMNEIDNQYHMPSNREMDEFFREF